MNAGQTTELFNDWLLPVPLTLVCMLTLVLYLRGFTLLRRTRLTLSPWRAASFSAGIAVLWLALASPLEELADTVLTAHMIEHLLLMMAVPPLVLAGWPVVPLLRGIPAAPRRLLHPVLRSRVLRMLANKAVSPVTAWLAMNVTLLLWHVPAAYDFALDHEAWHDIEHLCFLSSSLLFWWVLLRPWPSRLPVLGWTAMLYLISADFVNTALSAVLAFIGHPVYPYYLRHAGPLGLAPLQDQVLGASIMWVLGSIAFLLPALVLTARMLSPHGALQRRQTGDDSSCQNPDILVDRLPL